MHAISPTRWKLRLHPLTHVRSGRAPSAAVAGCCGSGALTSSRRKATKIFPDHHIGPKRTTSRSRCCRQGRGDGSLAGAIVCGAAGTSAAAIWRCCSVGGGRSSGPPSVPARTRAAAERCRLVRSSGPRGGTRVNLQHSRRCGSTTTTRLWALTRRPHRRRGIGQGGVAGCPPWRAEGCSRAIVRQPGSSCSRIPSEILGPTPTTRLSRRRSRCRGVDEQSASASLGRWSCNPNVCF